jgi:glycosyltransferase involved in cell wall biosynthesis
VNLPLGTELQGRRIVLVNWRDPWHSRAGGSERFAWEFAGALVDAGAEVEFWTARDRGQTGSQVHDGIRVRRLGGEYSFYGRALLALLGLRLRRRTPDVVVDMDCGIPVFTPVVLPRRTPVVLVVHHVHQEQFRLAMRAPMAWLGRFLEGRAMPRVYRGVPTLAVSGSTVDEMREQLGWRGEVRVLHNGTDPAPDLEVEPVPERVVVLGRVVAHKRVDLVVRAVAVVRRRRPGVTLDVVGTGDELDRVRAVVSELGLDGVVRLHGFLEDRDKSRALAEATLHVCASDAEGWGQVVLEAAAHGLPTLARDVPGMRDSVRDGRTGWLLDEPGSGSADSLVHRLADGMSAALDELGDAARRAEMADDCRAWAAGFGWDRMRREAVEAVVEASGHVDKLLPRHG